MHILSMRMLLLQTAPAHALLLLLLPLLRRRKPSRCRCAGNQLQQLQRQPATHTLSSLQTDTLQLL
jgi:hypothetical protein